MDIYLFKLINNFSHKFWLLDYAAIFTAEYLGYFLILAAIFLIFKEKKWRDKIYFFSFFALSLILSRGIVAEIIKFFIARPRPFLILEIQPLVKYDAYDVNMSFPSGHAAFYFALAFAVLLFYFKKEKSPKSKMGNWFLGGAVLISVARVFAGIHWPSDILIGAAIGIVSAYIVKRVLDIEYKKSFKSEGLKNKAFQYNMERL